MAAGLPLAAGSLQPTVTLSGYYRREVQITGRLEATIALGPPQQICTSMQESNTSRDQTIPMPDVHLMDSHKTPGNPFLRGTSEMHVNPQRTFMPCCPTSGSRLHLTAMSGLCCKMVGKLLMLLEC